MRLISRVISLGAIVHLCSSISAFSAETVQESIYVLAVSPQNQRSVVQVSNGQLHTVKAGEEIPQTNMEVIDVQTQKLIVRDHRTGEMIWIFQAIDPNPSVIQRFTNNVTPISASAGLNED